MIMLINNYLYKGMHNIFLFYFIKISPNLKWRNLGWELLDHDVLRLRTNLPALQPIAVIHPLLPVVGQSKRKVVFFCKSLSDFSRQFNNFFLRGKKAAFVFLQTIFVLRMRWHGFWTVLCREEKPDGRQLSLSVGNYNKAIKPQVNGNSLNICR